MWFLAIRNRRFFLISPSGSEHTCEPDYEALSNMLADAKWNGGRIMCSSSIDFPEDGGLSPDFHADAVIKKAVEAWRVSHENA